ncbi:MAG: molecular chaperone, partial [Nitrosopumilales archaeon CG11_big_fil_rev_8_21_14_0_20_33_24]
DNDKLTLLIDLPGFTKKDIKLLIDGNILSIKASKEVSDEKNYNMICN